MPRNAQHWDISVAKQTGGKRGTAALRRIAEMKLLDSFKMQLKRATQAFGQKRDAFTQAFAIPNRDVAVSEIDILHSQAATLHQA